MNRSLQLPSTASRLQALIGVWALWIVSQIAVARMQTQAASLVLEGLMEKDAFASPLNSATKSDGGIVMETTVGIFGSQAAAERALAQLKALGIGYDKITVLQPGMTNRQIETSVQTSDTEGPGMVAAMGGTVGGAIGVGAGASLGAAVVSLFVPGVGPIVAAGLLGAALLGTGGALAGAQAGGLLEGRLEQGLPHDELFVYEHALRNGHSVVIVVPDDSEASDRVHYALSQAGAESIDAARESWWVGLRETEAQDYEHTHTTFIRDETTYRQGFEAALHPKMRTLSYNDAVAQLDSELRADPAFRAGYERGQAYQRSLELTYGTGSV